jgi:hypothetical protein
MWDTLTIFISIGVENGSSYRHYNMDHRNAGLLHNIVTFLRRIEYFLVLVVGQI